MLNQIVSISSCKSWINRISGGDRSEKTETLFVDTTQLFSIEGAYFHIFELSIGKQQAIASSSPQYLHINAKKELESSDQLFFLTVPMAFWKSWKNSWLWY